MNTSFGVRNTTEKHNVLSSSVRKMSKRHTTVFREVFGIFKLIGWLQLTSYCGQHLAAIRASLDVICNTSACYFIGVGGQYRTTRLGSTAVCIWSVLCHSKWPDFPNIVNPLNWKFWPIFIKLSNWIERYHVWNTQGNVNLYACVKLVDLTCHTYEFRSVSACRPRYPFPCCLEHSSR
jgi:hypothetical protein